MSINWTKHEKAKYFNAKNVALGSLRHPDSPESDVRFLLTTLGRLWLAGAEIDYKDDLQGAQFVIKNPNATTTCGCGSSFSV